VVAAEAAVPAAIAASAAAMGMGRRILRRRQETEGGAAPPLQKEGQLDVKPAKEVWDPKLIVAGRGMALHRLVHYVRPQQEQLE
jgi:hypothetical protein